MAARVPHIRVIPGRPASRAWAGAACESEGCDLAAIGAGRCRACLTVNASAELLYRRLVTREMARLELCTPGLGRAALAALHNRLARPSLPNGGSVETQRTSWWVPQLWELERLEAFLVELRGRALLSGAAP